MSDQLGAERQALTKIRRVHSGNLERSRAIAQKLVDDAAAATDDGIRDLTDPDDEVDAAVEAALVRQSSVQAMHALRRLRELDQMGDPTSFGYTTADDGATHPVGRISVIDDDEVLLVDWRAAAAAPFYRATPLEPLGMTRRRHLLYAEESAAEAPSTSEPEAAVPAEVQAADLIGYSDEVFDVDDMADSLGLRGEAAILSALAAPGREHMKSVVATIQAEQDAVVRAPSNGPLVVQGGPGTGKTVVALHRAAYLLYNRRAALAESGVLVVGPSPDFLRYISRVLPSLGESGVISVTAPDLYPGIRRGHTESPEAARVKGTEAMVTLLANAVRDRQRKPTADLVAWYGSHRVVLTDFQLGELFALAKRRRTHNDGAAQLRKSVLEAFTNEVFNPAFDNYADAYGDFAADEAIEEFLVGHWPNLTPEQTLNDLLGSAALLRHGCRGTGLTRADRHLLERSRTPERELASRRWADADIGLLDELLFLLGGVMGGQSESERLSARDEADEFELADVVDRLADVFDLGEDDDDEDLGEAFDHAGLDGTDVADDLAGLGFGFDPEIGLGFEDRRGKVADASEFRLGGTPESGL